MRDHTKLRALGPAKELAGNSFNLTAFSPSPYVPAYSLKDFHDNNT